MVSCYNVFSYPSNVSVWLPLSARERKVNVVQMKRCTSSVVAVIIHDRKVHSDCAGTYRLASGDWAPPGTARVAPAHVRGFLWTLAWFQLIETRFQLGFRLQDPGTGSVSVV
jgi:hypothetical protein